MKSKYHIVIAKYKENMDWLHSFSGEPNVYLYDKESKRKNIGREAETFIYHILQYYDNLPDYIIFVQGNPFDHMKNITHDSFKKEIELLVSTEPTSTLPLFTSTINELYSGWPGMRVKEYTELFFGPGSAAEFPVEFVAGCQFIVPKHDILNKSKLFWYKLYSMILYGYDPNGEKIHFDASNPFDPDGIDGWTLERILFRIFKELHD